MTEKSVRRKKGAKLCFTFFLVEKNTQPTRASTQSKGKGGGSGERGVPDSRNVTLQCNGLFFLRQGREYLVRKSSFIGEREKVEISNQPATRRKLPNGGKGGSSSSAMQDRFKPAVCGVIHSTPSPHPISRQILSRLMEVGGFCYT